MECQTREVVLADGKVRGESREPAAAREEFFSVLYVSVKSNWIAS